MHKPVDGDRVIRLGVGQGDKQRPGKNLIGNAATERMDFEFHRRQVCDFRRLQLPVGVPAPAVAELVF